MYLSSIFTILSLFCYVNCEFPKIQIDNPYEDGELFIVKALFQKINWIMIEIQKINNKIDLQDNVMKKSSKDIEDINQTLNKILTDGMEMKQQILHKFDQQENCYKDIENFNQTLNKILTDGLETKQQLLQKIDQQEIFMKKTTENFNETINKILTNGMDMKQKIFQRIDLPDNIVTKSSKDFEYFNQTLNQILTDGLETKQQLLQKIDLQDNIIKKSSKDFEDLKKSINKILTDGLEMKQLILQRIEQQDNLITKSSKDDMEKTKETCNWLVILRRQDGTVDFDRNWSDYQNGFGYPNGEYFIGLDQLHAITNAEPQELLVILEDFNDDVRFAHYDHFVVGSAEEDYKLKKLGDFNGNAGDSLSQHEDFPFSTKDQDNDQYSGNCALNHKGGWWFDECYDSHLTGPYFQQPTLNENHGITWNSWLGGEYSLKLVKMMLRPKSCGKCLFND